MTKLQINRRIRDQIDIKEEFEINYPTEEEIKQLIKEIYEEETNDNLAQRMY